MDAVPGDTHLVSSGRRGRIRAWIFCAHLVLVCGLTLLFVIVALLGDPEDGANIGAGILLLPLLALGVPWSLPVITDPYRFDQVADALWYAVNLGPALLNVVLHGVLLVSYAVLRAKHRAR